jgi:hypothetical protein
LTTLAVAILSLPASYRAHLAALLAAAIVEERASPLGERFDPSSSTTQEEPQ